MILCAAVSTLVNEIDGVAAGRELAPYAPLYNAYAEQSIIGCMLIDNALVERIELLKPEHFYEAVNVRIFAKIKRAHEQGFAITKTTIVEEMMQEAALDDHDGSLREKIFTHIKNCFNAAATAINPEGLARLVVDMHLKRQLASVAHKTLGNIYASKRDEAAMQLVEEAEYELFQIALHGDYKRHFVKFDELTKETLNTIAKNYQDKQTLLGVTTGLIDLNRLLGGLQKSDLIIIAGRPSMGKTALAVNIALNACYELGKDKRSVGFFSLEMSAEQLTNRIISMKTGINSFRLKTGQISQMDYDSIVRCYQQELANLELFIDDTAGLSIASLRTRSRKLARKNNVAAIFVDYLQLIRGSSGRADSNRVQEISEITQELKNLAKELDIPIVALSQLSRAVEQREDKRPLLSDLRESGSIEQDADVVMFIYREEYYTRRSQPKEGSPEYAEWQHKMNDIMNQAEIIIAKQRNGPIGNVKLYYDSNTTTFKDMA